MRVGSVRIYFVKRNVFMSDRLSRTRALLGEEAMERLKNAHVAVFGIGGVGGYAVEALARSGVGKITLVDSDSVSTTNINRQIHALVSTVGMPKVEAAKTRILDISPDIEVNAVQMFYSADTQEHFDFCEYDYIIDAIDTVSSKILLIENADKCKTPIVSSMGTGNKLDPSRLEVEDIFKTSVCPLARVMRNELKKRGIKNLKVVYSKEEPIKPAEMSEQLPPGKHAIPASTAFVPAAAGLLLSSVVIRALSQKNR